MTRILCVWIIVVFSVIPVSGKSQDPITEVIRQGIIKVIKAVDLKIQRLQNETIWLQNAQKTLENTMSKLRLDEISDWVERQRQLYDDYFQELWKVKSVISTYHRVREIVNLQVGVVNEYKSAYKLFRGDKNFTLDELDYMYQVYTGILNESLKNLDQLFLVVNSFSTQMSDGKRLEIINDAYDRLQENMAALREFNNQNKLLSIQRTTSKTEIDKLRAYYGL